MEKQIKQLAIYNIALSVPLVLFAINYIIAYGFLSLLTLLELGHPIKSLNDIPQMVFISISLAFLALADGLVAIIKIFAGVQITSLKEKGRTLMIKASMVDIISKTITLMLIVYASNQLNKFPLPAIILAASILSLGLSTHTQNKLKSKTVKSLFLYEASKISVRR